MFLPSVIALALIPIIINIQTVVTDLQQTYMVQRRHRCKRRFRHHLPAYRFGYSQGKALAAVVLAMIMIGMALVCCLSLFRRVEKRSFVYVGCSVVYVVMTLASARIRFTARLRSTASTTAPRDSTPSRAIS